ncbi:uncharacterized protein [Haliotis cracherodii]|uniref:uncharacterized protein isoform X2 n=1 Tax=Haliotis cracherodii TaxID=6455 RepID=UPI0039E91026
MTMAHVMAVMLFLLFFLYIPKATDSLVKAKNIKHTLLVCNDDAAPPYNVTVLMCHGNTVLLEWQFDRHQDNLPPQLSFIVEYNTSYNPNEWVVAARLSADDRRAKITVPMWATFTFRVKAVNEMAVGKASAISHTKCKTPPGRPDRHPRNVRTIGDKMDYLVVEWEPMPRIELNAPGFFYNINVRKKDGSFRKNVLVYNYTMGRVEIPVNEAYQPYVITVGAENQLGRAIEGVKQILGYSGEAYPRDFPENLELDPDKNLTPTSAPLRWDPVDTSPEAVRGEFRGYKVHYRWIDETDAVSVHEIFIPDTSDADMTKKGRQSDKIRTELHNLPSSTEIEAYVEVANNYYSSEQSRGIKFLTQEGDNLDLWELKYSSADVDNTPLYTKNNTRVQLTCAGTFPNPVGDVTGEWRMLGSRFLIPPSHSRLVTSLISSPAHHYNGTLTLANVLVRDSGNFTFSLRDESGRDVGCSGPVQVYGPPLVTLLPLKNVFIKPWETVLLSCNVTQSSTNDTVITWFRNGIEVHGESTQLMDCATSGINATYSCLGENTFGKGRKSDERTVYRVQEPYASHCGA